MTPNQEPKYEIRRGKIVNRISGKAIPDDEPVFILRARDKYASHLLSVYRCCCKHNEHRKAIEKRIEQFDNFAIEEAARMKEPDTAMTVDWDNLKP